MNESIEELKIGKIIEQELRAQERSVVWFANKLGCERTNIYKIFQRDSVDTKLLYKISMILRRNFFDIYARELDF